MASESLCAISLRQFSIIEGSSSSAAPHHFAQLGGVEFDQVDPLSIADSRAA